MVAKGAARRPGDAETASLGRSSSVNTGDVNIWVVPPVLMVNGPLRPVVFRASALDVQCSTAVAGFHALLVLLACPACWTCPIAATVEYVGSKRNGELEGQSSINELLDQGSGPARCTRRRSWGHGPPVSTPVAW